jgi:hypothetical protein
MRYISVKCVPRLHSEDQKTHHVSVCKELKQQARDNPNFISNFITGDETWVYGYDPETKQQSLQWKLPHSPYWPEAYQNSINSKAFSVHP